MSKINDLILSKEFTYLPPYHETNPYTISIDLGSDNFRRAKKLAKEIYKIIFGDNEPDAIILDYYVNDYSDDSEDRMYCGELKLYKDMLINEAKVIYKLIELEATHQTKVVKKLPRSDASLIKEEDIAGRNRVICYKSHIPFKVDEIITNRLKGLEFQTGLVSFEYECIYSIYDEHKVDIVFSSQEDKEKLYEKLKPYIAR